MRVGGSGATRGSSMEGTVGLAATQDHEALPSLPLWIRSEPGPTVSLTAVCQMRPARSACGAGASHGYASVSLPSG
jgi:hypothetical protein